MALNFFTRLLGMQGAASSSCPDMSAFAADCGLVTDISSMATGGFVYSRLEPQLTRISVLGAGECTSIMNLTYSTSTWSAWAAMSCNQGYLRPPKRSNGGAGWLTCSSYEARDPGDGSPFDLETTEAEFGHGIEPGAAISLWGKWSDSLSIGSWSGKCTVL